MANTPTEKNTTAKNTTAKNAAAADATPSDKARKTPSVAWDDKNMRTTYANVVNATASREEVTVFFGTNLTWNPADAEDFKVNLSDRIILTPFAAKRLTIILTKVLADYERRHGGLKIQPDTNETH